MATITRPCRPLGPIVRRRPPSAPPTPTAVPRPFWLDRRTAPRRPPGLEGHAEADLCIVGGGFTGLWAALHAKTRDPARERRPRRGATRSATVRAGRNGGFLSSSITHGIGNGLARFPDEIDVLERLGLENFEGLRADLDRLGIDCDFEASGDIAVAVEPHQVAGLARGGGAAARATGTTSSCSMRDGIRAEVDSPTYLGGALGPDRRGARRSRPSSPTASPPPRRRARRPRSTSAARVDSPRARRAPGPLRCTLAGAEVRAGRVLLATNAFPPLLRTLRRYIVPVYDYVLVTEPLTAEQLEAIGWRTGPGDQRHRQPVPLLPADRRRPDPLGRLRRRLPLRRARSMRRLDVDEQTFAPLSQHFFATFPQLAGIRFTHAGAARSTPAAASRSSSAPATAAGSSSPAATPASASARRGSAPRVALDLARRPRDGGDRARATCAASRCPSRPSRCAGPWSSSPATGSPQPIATAAAAASGSASSTASASASTASMTVLPSEPLPAQRCLISAQERDQPLQEVVAAGLAEFGSLCA